MTSASRCVVSTPQIPNPTTCRTKSPNQAPRRRPVRNSTKTPVGSIRKASCWDGTIMVWGTILIRGRHVWCPRSTASHEFPIQDGQPGKDGSCSLVMVIPQGTRFVFFSDGGHQNDAIRGFKAIKHSIRRGDLDLCFLVPGRSGSSRSLFSYRFRLLIM